jgi:hypothetical protein
VSIGFNDLDPPARAYRYTSIRLYLMLLLGGALVPGLALAVTSSWHYVVAARATIAAQRLDVANNLANLVEREIGSYAGFLEGLAASRGFLENQSEAVQTATEMARARGFVSIAVFDAQGRPLSASSTGARQAIPEVERIGIKQALTRKRMVVSELQHGPGPSHLFFVSVPVSLNGQSTVIVSGSVAASRLQGLFAEAGLREGWSAGIVDQAGTIVARSREPETFVGKPAQRPMIEAARGVQGSGLFDVVTREGMEVRNAFLRSTLTGWTVGVAVPDLIESAPYWSTALSTGTLILSIILLGLCLAFAVARRITNAVRVMGRAVVALVTNEAVPLPTRTLLEFREVWRLIETLSVRQSKGVYRLDDSSGIGTMAFDLIAPRPMSETLSGHAPVQRHLPVVNFLLVLAVAVLAVAWWINA